jgi:predicted transcriptional regulator
MEKHGVLFLKTQKKITTVCTIFILTVLLTIAVLPVATGSNIQTESECVKINSERIFSDFSFAGTVDDSGNIYILYENDRDPDTLEYDIFMTSSNDGGKTFTEDVLINDVKGTVNEISPKSIVAYGNGNVCVVWPDERAGDHKPDIFFDRSTDRGITFSEDIQVNKEQEDPIWSSPSIDVDGSNNVYVVWHTENRSGDYIFLSKLNRGTTSFTEKVWVNEGVGDYQQWLPDLTVSDEGVVYIVWQNSLDPSTIQFTKSTDGGNSFSSAVELSSEGVDPDNADIVEHDGNLYVTWHEEHERYVRDEIMFAKSSDGGVTWIEPTSLGNVQNGIGKSEPSLITDSEGNVYAAWVDFSEYEQKIVIMKSSDSGNSWKEVENKNIETAATYPYYAELRTDANDNLYVIWIDGYEGAWDAYFTRIESESVQESETRESESSGVYLITIPVVIFIVIAFMAVAATEAGRYSILKLAAAPKYSRLKKDDVLNNETRQRIMNYIDSNPGVHFKFIQKSFNLASGSAAYHLSVLEREEYIVSRREGFYKRFFSKDGATGRISPEQYNASQITTDSNTTNQDGDNSANNIHDKILTAIRTYPGLTQTELAEQVGLTVTGVNYHVNIMSSAGVIRIMRDGKATRLFLIEV